MTRLRWGSTFDGCDINGVCYYVCADKQLQFDNQTLLKSELNLDGSFWKGIGA